MTAPVELDHLARAAIMVTAAGALSGIVQWFTRKGD